MTDPPAVADDAVRGLARRWCARKGRGVARLGTRSRPVAGEVLKLAVDTARLHLFDAATGRVAAGASADA